ncbi:MAG: arylsulfotransferase family protein [Acidimicrobiales bacterium]
MAEPDEPLGPPAPVDATRPHLISRRRLLQGLGALAGAGLASSVVGCSPFSPASPDGSSGRTDGEGYRSRPDLRPPSIVIDTHRPGTDPGLVITECHAGTGQQGPMIVGDRDLVWFKPVSDHGTASLRAFNVRVQPYRGAPVLCWFEGAVVDGHGSGHYVIADSSYRQVATVEGGNGLTGDLHELFLTEAGTAVFTAYGTATADLSAYGGSRKGAYFYGEVQEVDVATGRLVYSWRSDTHVGFAESYAPAPGNGSNPWDYFHINSIDVDPSDGNLIVSSRNCWAFYKVDRRTGALVWRLGGKRSDFSMATGTHFAYQHDVTPQGGGVYTIFDNEGSPWVDPPSRGLALHVDEGARRVSLVRQYLHSPPVRSGALGSVQDLPAGHVFIGWGQDPYFTEYDASGRVLFDGHLVGSGLVSYRAFKQAWTGRPSAPPDIAVERSGASTVIYVSWNGATEVARWRVLAGSSSSRLAQFGTYARAGFETRITLSTHPRQVALEALDASGRVLGRSRAHPA